MYLIILYLQVYPKEMVNIISLKEVFVMVKLKNDQYRRIRGGSAVLLDIYCASCGYRIMRYQKDGNGDLLRCYLNRIFEPYELEKLQDDPDIQGPRNMSNLVCQSCHHLIGVPMRHSDGRLAFRLSRGSFAKKKYVDRKREAYHQPQRSISH